MKKKLVLMLMFLVCIFTLIGCGKAGEVKSIEILSGFDTEFEQNEQLDLSKIQIKVNYNDGSSTVVAASNAAITVSGFDTAVVTNNGKATVSYSGISVEVSYRVLGVGNVVTTPAGVQSELQGTEPIVTLRSGSEAYDLSSIAVDRDVVIRGKKDEVVEVKNVTVNNSAATVEVNDITVVAPTPATGTAPTVKITAAEEVKLNNVTIEVGTKSESAIAISNKQSEVVLNEAKIVAEEGNNNAISKLIVGSTGKEVAEASVTLKNSIVEVPFAYGISSVNNVVLENNYIDCQLTQSSTDIDSTGAKLFVAAKNPVLYQYQLPGDANEDGKGDGVLEVICKNNTFKNLQNVFRFHNLDLYTNTSEWNIDVSGNTLVNCNVLAAGSTNSYVMLKAFVNAIQQDPGFTTGYQTEMQFKAEKNTVFGLVGDSTAIVTSNTKLKVATAGKAAGTAVSLYYDLDNANANYFYHQIKYTTDAANKYEYVGNIGGWGGILILKNADNFYFAKVDYSADGLDEITFIDSPITLAELKAKLN